MFKWLLRNKKKDQSSADEAPASEAPESEAPVSAAPVSEVPAGEAPVAEPVVSEAAPESVSPVSTPDVDASAASEEETPDEPKTISDAAASTPAEDTAAAAAPAEDPAEDAPADPPLLESEIVLIQDSFGKVAPIADQAAALFYSRLFEIAPEVRPLFRADITEQGKKLMATLAVVVNGLRDLGAIVPVAQDLARRHVGYGVEAAHYEPVGAALIWTLEQGLGEAFTTDTQAAWVKAYGVLSSVMIEAQEGVQ